MITITEDHEYTVNGEPRESVSAYISRHEQEFPKEIIAGKIAERDDRTVADVLNEWSLKGKIACNFGSAIHDALDLYTKYKEEPKNELLALIVRKYAHTHNVDEIKREVSVYDDKLAGTIDEIEYVDREKKIVIIRDQKTNNDLYKKGKKLLPPYDFLTDMPIDVYTLQLSLYKKMLEYHGWTVHAMYIDHIQIGIHDDAISVEFNEIEVEAI